MSAMNSLTLTPVYAKDTADFLENEWDVVVQTLGARLEELTQALQHAAAEMANAPEDEAAIEQAVDPVTCILMDYDDLWTRLTQRAAERRLQTGSEALPDGEPLPTIPNRFEQLAKRAQETRNPQQAQSSRNETPANSG